MAKHAPTMDIHIVPTMCNGVRLTRNGHWFNMKFIARIMLPNLWIVKCTYEGTHVGGAQGAQSLPKIRCLWLWHKWCVQRWCLRFKLIGRPFQAIKGPMCLCIEHKWFHHISQLLFNWYHIMVLEPLTIKL